MVKEYKNDFMNPEILKRIEQVEKTSKVQEGLNEIRRGIHRKTSNFFNPKYIVMFLFSLLALQFSYYLFVIFLIVCFSTFGKNEEETVDIDNPYENNVILPILQEIFPGTSLNYSEGIDEDVFIKLIPKSEKYYSDCHIIFADEFKTEFSNMSAYHYRSSKKSGYISINDFYGQVMLIRQKTNIRGHIRIVPLINSNSENDETYMAYGIKMSDETEIKTESIYFNESYSIFSTDQFYPKLILDPITIEILNDWSKKIKVCVYIDENYIAVGFDSRRRMFSMPTTSNETANLSLGSEYEKVRKNLGDFYNFINIIREKI